MFSYGNKYRITIYGASHEESMGVIIDGIKPGVIINKDLIKNDLEIRKPKKIGTTKRIEQDDFKITNGIFNGFTTGAPIHIIFENKNIISKDYNNLNKHPRPNHADYVANIKYQGFNDYRGGGFFSGRLTTLLVSAGSIAKQLIPVKISSEILEVGNLENIDNLDSYLEELTNNNDSAGGVVLLRVSGINAGIGDPYFNKLDSEIAKMMLTIPGVRGIVFGEDFDTKNLGSTNNDLIINEFGKTKTNHSGGIVGGISNGNDIVFKVFVKPTSSISKEQETFNFENMKLENLEIKGRHDTAFIRRIPIVLENALAIVLANFMV